MAAHGLPVLGAADVEQPLVDAPLHGRVEHLEELGPDEGLGAAQARQEGRLQLRRDVTSREALVPGGEMMKKKKAVNKILREKNRSIGEKKLNIKRNIKKCQKCFLFIKRTI